MLALAASNDVHVHVNVYIAYLCRQTLYSIIHVYTVLIFNAYKLCGFLPLAPFAPLSPTNRGA